MAGSKLSTINQFAFSAQTGRLSGLKTFGTSGSPENTVVVPSTVTTLGGSAFERSSVENVDLSQMGVNSLSNTYLFNGCTNLKSITLPENLASVGNYFLSNTGLETIDLSKTKLTSIQSNMFQNASSLTTVTFPEPSGNYSGVTSINSNAFSGTKLSGTLKIKTSAPLTINAAAFSSMNLGAEESANLVVDLSEAVVPTNGVMFTNPGGSSGAFQDNKRITQMILPTGLTSLSNKLFQNASNFATFGIATENPRTNQAIIPATMSSLGEQAFAGTAIQAADLSNAGIYSMENGLFADAANLKTVVLPNNVVQIGQRTFGTLSSNANGVGTPNLTSIGTRADLKLTTDQSSTEDDLLNITAENQQAIFPSTVAALSNGTSQ